jgi:hypothetical protein
LTHALGIGASKSAAVSAVLVNRALSVGVTIALAILVMAILHDEWRTVRRPRPGTTAAGETTAQTAARAKRTKSSAPALGRDDTDATNNEVSARARRPCDALSG